MSHRFASPSETKMCAIAASVQQEDPLEAEMNCVVCLDVLLDPVTLECSHTICRNCLVNHFEASEAMGGHPRCASGCKLSSFAIPPVNTMLRSIVERTCGEKVASRKRCDEVAPNSELDQRVESLSRRQKLIRVHQFHVPDARGRARSARFFFLVTLLVLFPAVSIWHHLTEYSIFSPLIDFSALVYLGHYALVDLAHNVDSAAVKHDGAWTGPHHSIASLVALASSGTEQYKELAAAALQRLAHNADNQAAIVKAGGIYPFVAHARSGTDDQKERAAWMLGNLAHNADNQAAIVKAGGIYPLVALATSGTDGQKERAAWTLANLAFNADNQAAIVKAGGIEPLVVLATSGTDGQKQQVVWALRFLARNANNQDAIVKAGGIEPLVELAASGTDGRKERAAWTRARFVRKGNQVATAKARGIEPVVAIARSRTDGQKSQATVLWDILHTVPTIKQPSSRRVA